MRNENAAAVRPGSWIALGLSALLFSLSCAGNSTVGRINSPPRVSGAAIAEAEAICQPTGNPEAPCRSVRVTIELCDPGDPDDSAYCDVARGVHDLLRDLNAYRKYVAELNGDPRGD